MTGRVLKPDPQQLRHGPGTRSDGSFQVGLGHGQGDYAEGLEPINIRFDMAMEYDPVEVNHPGITSGGRFRPGYASRARHDAQLPAEPLATRWNDPPKASHGAQAGLH